MKSDFGRSNWFTIEEFPEYEINSIGVVRNRNSRRVLRKGITVEGTPYVTLRKDLKSWNRSVAKLVRLYVPRHIPRL